MGYLKYLFVVLVVLFITSSYTTTTSSFSEGINPGKLIPDFQIENNTGKFKLSDFKGQKVLVQLWAAYDADSHMKNVLLSNMLKRGNFDIKMISVAFDESKAVFEKTVYADGVGEESQFVDTLGSNSNIYKTYQLSKGFSNYLIDENGLIIAKNLNPEDLNNYLN